MAMDRWLEAPAMLHGIDLPGLFEWWEGSKEIHFLRSRSVVVAEVS